MIPSLSHPSILSRTPIESPLSQIILDPNFDHLSLSDKLQSIGLIDNNFKILFTPSKIKSIDNVGQERFTELMDLEVQCCTKNGDVLGSVKHSEYLSGFAEALTEKGFKIRSYLRGGYAVYVACLGDYFEHLIKEYLKYKNINISFADEIAALKKQDQAAVKPSDVDIFDYVLNDNFSPEALREYHLEFLAKYGNKKKIKEQGLRQLLIPEVSDAFPFTEKYVLFTTGNDTFQTDRIIGRLHHEYLYTRDDIRIEIKNNQMCIPESAGNFWQMVIDRTLKIVRTEDWHKKDFRAGLAAIQLIQNNHILIDANCTLESIIQHALLTKSDLVFSCAISRAKLHGKDTYGFLMSVLIAYSHVASLNQYIIPDAHLKILTDAILEKMQTIPLSRIPETLRNLTQELLANLYKLAVLLTNYEDTTQTYHAKWEPTGSGLLILDVNDHRIIFPKYFNAHIKPDEKLLLPPQLSFQLKATDCPANLVYRMLDNNTPLSYLERVLFEITLIKPLTPLTDSMLEALIQYLIHTHDHDERVMLAALLPEEFLNAKTNTEWIKALLNCSFKHGLKLWNASKNTMDDHKWKTFEEIIKQIVLTRPNQAYILIEEESPPKSIRINFLKKLTESESLNRETLVKILDELLDNDSLSYLERVLFELKLLKPSSPLTEPLKKALIEYLIHTNVITERITIASHLPKEFLNAKTNTEWIKALLNYSFKHGLRLWNLAKNTMHDHKWKVFEGIIDQIFLSRPNQAYALIEEESPPNHLKYKLLEKLIGHESLSIQTSAKLAKELIKRKIAIDQAEEAATFLQNHKTAFKNNYKPYIKFIKQLHLQGLAKKWIEDFPTSERREQTLLFFSEYHSSDHPLLEAICSLPGLNKKDIMETLYDRGMPVFSDRDFKDLISLLNSDLSEITKLVIIEELSEVSIPNKEFGSLERFMEMNPTLSLHLISSLLKKQNDDYLPIIIRKLTHLKNTKHLASKEDKFITHWKTTLERSSSNPQMLLELIPFYKNFGWVKSIYGATTAKATRKWGAQALSQEKLTDSDKGTIHEILSRLKLKLTPEFCVAILLGALKLPEYETVKETFHKTVSRLLIHIKTDNPVRLYQFEILLQLLKHGMAAKFLTMNGFLHIKNAMICSPQPFHEDGQFDPIFHLLQSLPLVDYESEETHHIWNEERNDLLEMWEEATTSNNKSVKDMMGCRVLKTIPYTDLKIIIEHANRYKWITELFIDQKITKEDFQLEVNDITRSIGEKFASQELMSHEDPCLICINDFIFLLKIQNKRERAYQAFYYLLNQRKQGEEVKSRFLDEQLQYLKYRKETEDLILLNSTLHYSAYMKVVHKHIGSDSSLQSYSFENLHIQDPILDAFKMELLHPMAKLDFLKLWMTKLKLNPSPHALHHANSIESFFNLEKERLELKDVENFILKQISKLKRLGLSKEKKQTEGAWLLTATASYFPDRFVVFQKVIEKTLEIKLCTTTEPIESLKIEIEQPNLKSCLEYLSNEKVTDENLLRIFHATTISNIISIETEESLQHYPFRCNLDLIKMGIESKILPSKYFAHMVTMVAKASDFILESENKVIFDPYVDFLKTLSLVDMGSEKEANELNAEKIDFLDYWLNLLKLSENPNIISYANENITLEFLSYENLKVIHNYVQQFKCTIEDFLNNKVNSDIFMEKISLLCVSAFKNIQIETFSQYTDPCLITLKELSFYLRVKELRNKAYAAFNHLSAQWSINLKLTPSYLNEYRTYLNYRRSIEEDILSQIAIIEAKPVYYNFMLTSSLQSLFETSIPSNIHILDPVFCALQLEDLSLIERLPLLQYWVAELNKHKTAQAQYQLSVIANYIEIESKKIKEEDAEKAIKKKIADYKSVRHMIIEEDKRSALRYISYMGDTFLAEEKKRSILKEVFYEAYSLKLSKGLSKTNNL